MADRCTLSGQPDDAALEKAKEGGVRTVMNLRLPREQPAGDERARVAALGMQYLAFPIDPAAPDPATVDAFLAAMRTVSQPVLVHCATGKRAAALWAIHRAVNEGVAAERAIEEARRRGLASPPLEACARAEIARRRPAH